MTDRIKDPVSAITLAQLVLSMEFVSDKGRLARRLARQVLGIADCGSAPAAVPITTNGTTRLVPYDEPVFLLRGQDADAAEVVRFWAQRAEERGADSAIVCSAREHADKMDAWPKKKIPDLAAADQQGEQG